MLVVAASTVQSMRKLLYLPDGFPSPSPAPQQLIPGATDRESVGILSSMSFDYVTLSLIGALLLLSFTAFTFIFYLRLRSRGLQHLENFNSLWTVRLLLVSLASLWSLNEILRLPFLRRKYLYPFLPALTLEQQANICNLHVVLSLGFLEPGFLITLLFLVNVSINSRNPSRLWALVSLFIFCSPLTVLQIIFVQFWPLLGYLHLPEIMVQGSSFPTYDVRGHEAVLCVYPLFSCLTFGAFTIVYAVVFSLRCWRVMAFVINKSLISRIRTLATTLMVALPLQSLFLIVSWLWMPEDYVYGSVVLAMFLCVALCVVIGEVVLVLKPIKDALAAAAEEDQGRAGL